MAKQLTLEKLQSIEQQIQIESVPYIYDTKEYPVEVVVAKVQKNKFYLVPQNFNWLESNEFKYHTTTDASNNPGKLKKRVEFVRDCLLGIQTDLTYPNE